MSGTTRAILYRVAFIFMCISLVGWIAIGIVYSIMEANVIGLLFWIPLLWLTPMTLFTNNAYKEAGFAIEKGHTALGVCEIIFGGFVAGVLVTVAAAGFSAINRIDPGQGIDADINDFINKQK